MKLAGCVALLCAMFVGVASGSGEALNLSKVLLSPRQVGPGYVLRTPDNGRGVAAGLTLGFCGTPFPSEQLRTQRLQVNYIPAATAVQASNEIVTYKPGTAKKALAEIAYAIGHCTKARLPDPAGSLAERSWRVKEKIKIDNLLPGYIAYVMDEKVTSSGLTVETFHVDVYQVSGDVFSGVYVYVVPNTTLAEALEVATRAAQASAARLRGLG